MSLFFTALDTTAFWKEMNAALKPTRIGAEHQSANQGLGPRVDIVVYNDVRVEDLVVLRDALTTMIDRVHAASDSQEGGLDR